ncbi:uncharacterized protein LOC107274554 isoform X1 [Cephus cinctus]|uniref:Uncharacterized protein LOC107274554 isoform X1 n=1 Tax=Cephus cinctus TaxID=211228 RepID=A0AAJ7RUV2_CEPCN|nr:uncharacterized protein LOC107274554 isoform X1 [Cephus cinctus]
MSPSDRSDIFEEEFLKEHLLALASSLGIEEPRYRVLSASGKGENFIGVVYRVCLWQNDRDNDKRWFIFKVAPRTEIQRLYTLVAIMFENEVAFYTKIVPLFEEILKRYKKSLDFVPKCYRTSLRECEEIVILEDLAQRGFTLRDRLDQFDYCHASKALRHLGRLHALSFALRDQRPETLEIFGKVRENLFNKNNLSNEIFQYRYELVADSVRTVLSDEDPKYVKRFNKFYETVWTDSERACMPKEAEPYSVISHGDSWSNNILFKYKKDSPEPEDVCLIDFQFYRFASPALDIHYLIYSSTNQELRDEYYDRLIRDYYDSLAEYLRGLGSDPTALFPLDVLRDHLTKFGFFAGAIAVITLHIVTANREEGTEVNDVEKLKERVMNDTHYRVTLRDAFKDIIDRDYI